MTKRNLLVGALALLSAPIFAQVTWRGPATGGDWQVATNWSSNALPTATDSVVLQNATTDTLSITNIPATVSITKLSIGNATKVRLTGAVVTAAATTTINITGGTGVDFVVGSNTALIWSGGAVANAISINLATGATGEVFGFMQLTSAGVSHTHRFQAVDSAAVTFRNNSTFVMGPNATGNPFGQGVPPSGMKSMTFDNGSLFIQNGGSNPFGATAPSSAVTFLPNSTFRVNGTGTITAGGRTYGNLEFTNAGYTASSTATSLFLINGNLIVNAGAPVFTASGAGGMVIKGNITVASGASVKFGTATNCPVTLNGTTEQTITNNGTMTFTDTTIAPLTQLIVDNPAGAKLGSNLTLLRLTLLNGKFKLGNFNLNMQKPNSVGEFGINKYIVTDGTGKFKMPVVTGTVNSFPVGLTAGANDINLLSFVPTAADTVSVRVVPTTSGWRNVNHGITRSWEVSRVGTAAGDTVSFGYNPATQVGSYVPANSNLDIATLSGTTWSALQTNIAPTNALGTMKQVLTFTRIANLSTTFSIGTTGRVGAPNSIETTAAERGVRVFPSLATDNLTIENKNEGVFDYQIVDMQGKIQLTGKMSKQTNLNISNLAKGTYLLRMNEATVRFVKQ